MHASTVEHDLHAADGRQTADADVLRLCIRAEARSGEADDVA